MYKRQYQHNLYNDNYSGVDLSGSPEIEDIAKAYSVPFVKINDMSEVDDGIEKFLADKEACIMEVNVFSFESSKETR